MLQNEQGSSQPVLQNAPSGMQGLPGAGKFMGSQALPVPPPPPPPPLELEVLELELLDPPSPPAPAPPEPPCSMVVGPHAAATTASASPIDPTMK